MHMAFERKRLVGAAEVKLCKPTLLCHAQEAVSLDSDRDSDNAFTEEQPEPCSEFGGISIFQGDVAAQAVFLSLCQYTARPAGF